MLEAGDSEIQRGRLRARETWGEDSETENRRGNLRAIGICEERLTDTENWQRDSDIERDGF